MSDTETLNKLVNHTAILETEIAKTSAMLAELNLKRKELLQKHIPEAMEACSLSSFESTNGYKVKVSEKVYASIPEETRDSAYEWLKENNMGDIVKTKFECQIARDQEDLQNLLRESLDHIGLSPTEKTAIHYATLNKNMGEVVEAGELDIPESIKVSIINEAKIKYVQS